MLTINYFCFLHRYNQISKLLKLSKPGLIHQVIEGIFEWNSAFKWNLAIDIYAVEKKGFLFYSKTLLFTDLNDPLSLKSIGNFSNDLFTSVIV